MVTKFFFSNTKYAILMTANQKINVRKSQISQKDQYKHNQYLFRLCRNNNFIIQMLLHLDLSHHAASAHLRQLDPSGIIEKS